MTGSGKNSAALIGAIFTQTLRMWGELSPCKMEERDGALFLSTGVAIADQNYAVRTGEGHGAAMAEAALGFFAREEVPFTWWVPPLPGAREEGEELAAAGLSLQCAPPAMILPLLEWSDEGPTPPEVEIIKCSAPEDGQAWAKASLKGFRSSIIHQKTFGAFVSAMVTGPTRENFCLLILLYDGEPAATSMVIFTPEGAGIFYFSVLKKFRRKGLGKALLSKSLEEAKKAGCSAAALSASPMGFPLYKQFGFQEWGRFLVHSATPDAC